MNSNKLYHKEIKVDQSYYKWKKQMSVKPKYKKLTNNLTFRKARRMNCK